MASLQPHRMGTARPDGQACRDELDRVLLSACFVRSERVSKLLRFLVETQLEGREHELKESVIGVEVLVEGRIITSNWIPPSGPKRCGCAHGLTSTIQTRGAATRW